MKKQLLMICITIILLTVGLSGCDEEIKIEDTDRDGYLDDIDDFPNDTNLHEKIIWYQFENKKLVFGTTYPTADQYKEILSDVKYVEWTWNLINPNFPEAKIEFNIARMIDNYRFVIYSYTGRADSNRFTVNNADIGMWLCYWYYTTDQDYGNLYFSATVFILK